MYVGLFLDEFKTKPEHLESCHCLSTCQEIQYVAQVSSYKFPSQSFAEDLNIPAGLKPTINLILNSFFKLSYFIPCQFENHSTGLKSFVAQQQ